MQLDNALYHYTSAEALMGIIKSRSIWASNISYLNDEQEYFYATNLIKPFLDQIERNSSNSFLLDFLTKLMIRDHCGPVFVASFSKDPDLLSQWRAYCKDGGFSIGFKRDDLNRIAVESGFEIVKCIYDVKDQEKLIQHFINSLTEDISMLAEPVTARNDALKFYAGKVNLQLKKLINIIKHPAFKEERECRLVRLFVEANNAHQHFRAYNGLLIPYYEIPLEKEVNKNNKFTQHMMKESIQLLSAPTIEG